jgi:hypothetical protein
VRYRSSTLECWFLLLWSLRWAPQSAFRTSWPRSSKSHKLWLVELRV